MQYRYIISKKLCTFVTFLCSLVSLKSFVINYASFAVSTRLLSNVKYDSAVLKICKNVEISK